MKNRFGTTRQGQSAVQVPLDGHGVTALAGHIGQDQAGVVLIPAVGLVPGALLVCSAALCGARRAAMRALLVLVRRTVRALGGVVIVPWVFVGLVRMMDGPLVCLVVHIVPVVHIVHVVLVVPVVVLVVPVVVLVVPVMMLGTDGTGLGIIRLERRRDRAGGRVRAQPDRRENGQQGARHAYAASP
jgi:hypothetical protein